MIYKIEGMKEQKNEKMVSKIYRYLRDNINVCLDGFYNAICEDINGYYMDTYGRAEIWNIA